MGSHHPLLSGDLWSTQLPCNRPQFAQYISQHHLGTHVGHFGQGTKNSISSVCRRAGRRARACARDWGHSGAESAIATRCRSLLQRPNGVHRSREPARACVARSRDARQPASAALQEQRLEGGEGTRYPAGTVRADGIGYGGQADRDQRLNPDKSLICVDRLIFCLSQDSADNSCTDVIATIFNALSTMT